MNRISFLLFFLLISQMQSAVSQNHEFSRLVEQKKFTELKKRLQRQGIDHDTKNMYQAILLNVFSKPALSNDIIGGILKNGKLLSDSIRFMLLQTQHDNYVKMFNYFRGYETKKYLLDNYSPFFKNENLDDEIQILNILKALKDEAPQYIADFHKKTLPISNNFIGVQTIPVKINSTTYSFIFDTGAGFSTISNSMATILKLKILDKESISIKGGVTGLSTKVKLGIADKIDIGDIVVNNVVFLVFPDSSLTINLKEGKFLLEPILGFPVIKELGSITVHTDKIEIDSYSTEVREPNMAVDFLKPILFLNYKGSDLPFTFDTGAGHSILTEVFYNNYKNIVEKEGVANIRKFSGAGGTKDFKVFELPIIHFRIFEDTITLKHIDVSIEKISTANDVYYGNLGQDLIKQYRSMTMNFQGSWIKFNK